MAVIPSWARVGAKVVCIDDTGFIIRGARTGIPRAAAWWGYVTPVKDGIYTIREFTAEGGVRLAEIDNSAAWRQIPELGFKLSRFRPLISQQDDLSTHFEQFLHTPQKIEERA